MANELARDAERSVLGGILITGDPAVPAGLGLTPGHFHDAVHVRVFTAMLDLGSRQEPIDELTVFGAMRDVSDGPRQGWAVYIAELTQEVPTSANIAHHAEIVRREARRRDAVRVLTDGLAKARQEGVDGDNVIAELVLQLGRLEAGRQLAHAYSARDLVTAELKAVEVRSESKVPPGTPTCLSPIDNRLGGMTSGGLMVIAARPSMGKSALATGIAKDLATRKGIGALVFSLEMTGQEQVQRMLASEGGVDLHRIRSGNMTADGWPALARACNTLAVDNLHIVDKGDLSIAELRSMARAHAARHKIGLVVVDYLQLVAGEGQTREQEVASVSRGLKALAMELRIPVIALSQLSRAVEGRSDKRPLLSDLRESGSLEQDAHQVVFIYRDDYYHPENSQEPGIAEIAIAKNRNGPTGLVKLRWSGKHTRFSPIDDDAELPLPAKTAVA